MALFNTMLTQCLCCWDAIPSLVRKHTLSSPDIANLPILPHSVGLKSIIIYISEFSVSINMVPWETV